MAEPVEVDLGNGHMVLMTAAEAAALTSEDKARWAVEAKAIDDEVQERLKADAIEQDSITAAADEQGEVLVRVWCGACKDGRRDAVATVRSSSRGPVFEGVGRVEMSQVQKDYLIRRMKQRGGRRIPWLARGRVIVLLDGHGGDWPPRADCMTHGALSVDFAELERAIAERARSGKAATVVVHPEITAR